MKLREKAIQSILDAVTEAAAYSHQCNYWRLHVHRDGDVRWSEYIDQHSTLIDDSPKARDASRSISEVPTIIRVGTGGYRCNCDYCDAVGKPDGYDTHDEAIADAVSDSDTVQLEADMLDALDQCPQGYFDDEDSPRPLRR